MTKTLLVGHTIALQSDDAVEVRPNRLVRPAFFLSSRLVERSPMTLDERTKRRSSNKQIVTIDKGGETFHAAAVDLGFELYTRGEPTPMVITNIVKRYLRVALEAKNQQPDQQSLFIVLFAKLELLAKVEANNSANPHNPASHVLVSSDNAEASQPIPLEVILHRQPQASQTKTFRRGQVQGEEIRQLLQTLREPGHE